MEMTLWSLACMPWDVQYLEAYIKGDMASALRTLMKTAADVSDSNHSSPGGRLQKEKAWLWKNESRTAQKKSINKSVSSR